MYWVFHRSLDLYLDENNCKRFLFFFLKLICLRLDFYLLFRIGHFLLRISCLAMTKKVENLVCFFLRTNLCLANLLQDHVYRSTFHKNEILDHDNKVFHFIALSTQKYCYSYLKILTTMTCSKHSI